MLEHGIAILLMACTVARHIIIIIINSALQRPATAVAHKVCGPAKGHGFGGLAQISKIAMRAPRLPIYNIIF